MKCALLLVIALFIASTANLKAQGLQNAITGQVTDTSGAALPNTAVTVTNIKTNVSTVVHTDDTGRYTAPALVVGEYSAKAEAPGMQAFASPGNHRSSGSRG